MNAATILLLMRLGIGEASVIPTPIYLHVDGTSTSNKPLYGTQLDRRLDGAPNQSAVIRN